jgi:manganese oxidase
MSDPSGPGRYRFGRLREIVLLTLVLSVGVVGFEFLVHVVSAHATGGAGHGIRDVVISLPMAVTAVCLGLWLARRLGYERPGPLAAFNRSAVVSLVFGVALIPSVGIHSAVDSFLGDGATAVDPLTGLTITSEANGSLWGLVQHGVHDALIGQAVGLPLLFLALLVLGGLQARRRAPRPPFLLRWRGLPRLAYGAVAVATIGYAFGGPASGVAFVGGVVTASADTTSSTSSNPCATAPLDTFNVSAINIKMILNRFGVNDPNALMYVLDQNISAVQAEEQSGQVSIGLGTDPIQPLVLRAHEGDCVTINFTNRTTFGLLAMDQPPAPDPVNGCNNGPPPQAPGGSPPNCDGTLAHTAPENLAWNVDGLPGVTAADVSSTVGNNADKTAAPGQTVSYTVYMDPAMGDGAHAFHSTGDDAQLTAHGLFGSLISEPVGSQWLDPTTLQPIQSGWEAVIQMPSGASLPTFREFSLIFHEVGDEGYRQIEEANGTELPVVDPFTQAYRPCSKAINYRSECFYERLLNLQNNGFIPDESQQYGSYMNGDMATPQPQAYLGDPYIHRLMNAGAEMAHVYHEHGGGIRWRRNPGADNPDIAGGLEKQAKPSGTSIRVDSQTIQPGESYSLYHECGAGGCQQAAGDFLFHCHIANHYIAGMLGFMRVFDTQQANLATVPGRAAKPQAVNSAGLIGLTIQGKTVVPRSQLTDPSTQTALEDLVEGQLPPQGTRLNPQDSTVWDWVKGGTTDAPIYFGEPEDTHVWADFSSPNPGVRPEIMFDPTNGRYAWPLVRPHLGQRPPFSPNGHSGTPWLGPTTSSTRPDGLCPAGATVNHFNITAIQVNIQETRGSTTGLLNPPEVDSNGQIFVLNEDKAAVEKGTKPAVPLVVRDSVGQCDLLTLTSELNETSENHNHSKVNMHTHFVQFDPQASDGVITGFSYEQSVAPDTTAATLAAAAKAGDTQISVSSTTGLRPGITIEVGMGEVDTEIAKITAIGSSTSTTTTSTSSGTTLTLAQPLTNAHAKGEKAGTEFVQYAWYSDVDAGTVFFHDHVDGIHSWGHGLFAAHIIEPAGSTFHDPVSGAVIRSGPIADIFTSGSAGFGESGSFREFVLFQHTGLTGTGSPQGCEMSSFNLRAAPLIDRDPNAANPNNGPAPGNSVPFGVGNYGMGYTSFTESGVDANGNVNPAPTSAVLCDPVDNIGTNAPGGNKNVGIANDPYVFSSVAHGDPATPLLRAYVGDPVVIRQVGLDERVGDLRITGHRFAEERFNANGTLTDAGTTGISERFDYVIDGGAGGARHLPGDYLYYSGRNNELESGAWGIFRVMNTLHNDLEVLPGTTAPPSGSGFPSLSFTGKAPPAAPNGPGTKACPSTAPVRSYNVSIFNFPGAFDPGQGGELSAADGNGQPVMYSLSSDEASIKAGTKPAVPLVIRANQGDCLQVTLHNDQPADSFTWTWGSGSTRAGFNVGNIIYDPQQSYGAAIGFDPDTTVAPGSSRIYSFFVDKETGTNLVDNFGNESTLINGAYGAVIAEPKGATYTDPATGNSLLSGIAADIHFPQTTSSNTTTSAFREFVTLYSDREPLLGHSIMIYYLDDDHSYIDYNQQSLSVEEGSSLTNINLWQAKSDAVIGCTNTQAATGSPATCTTLPANNKSADPATPVFNAKAGDPVRWRIAAAAGYQGISFGIMGHAFPLDHGIAGSMVIDNRTLFQGETFDAYLVNGAGGATQATGDFQYGNNRRPEVKSGMWGIFRVLAKTDGTIKPL